MHFMVSGDVLAGVFLFPLPWLTEYDFCSIFPVTVVRVALHHAQVTGGIRINI